MIILKKSGGPNKKSPTFFREALVEKLFLIHGNFYRQYF